MLFKIVLLFYGSIFYGDPQSNSLQYFSAINTQQDFKKNIILRSNHLADHEKGKMMSLFWNYIQNGLKGIYEENNINLNNNMKLRKWTRQVVKRNCFFNPALLLLFQSAGNKCKCGKCGSDSRRCGAEAIVQFYREQTEDYLWFGTKMKIPICLGGLISPLHVLSTKSCFLTSDNKAIMKTHKRFKTSFLV